jgi:hypothetical protein
MKRDGIRSQAGMGRQYGGGPEAAPPCPTSPDACMWRRRLA